MFFESPQSHNRGTKTIVNLKTAKAQVKETAGFPSLDQALRAPLRSDR